MTEHNTLVQKIIQCNQENNPNTDIYPGRILAYYLTHGKTVWRDSLR